MADLKNSWKENTKGKIFVDKSCVCCDLCFENAPRNFIKASDFDDRHSYVKKQPETPDEFQDVEKAIDWCPVNAIGKIDKEI